MTTNKKWFTVDGKVISDTDRQAIDAKNQAVFEDAIASNDMSKLMDIEWLFGEEVENACTQ